MTTDTQETGKNPSPLISDEAWMKIKSGATTAGIVVGVVLVCAVSTFICAYAQSYGTRTGGKGSLFPDRSPAPNKGTGTGTSSKGSTASYAPYDPDTGEYYAGRAY